MMDQRSSLSTTDLKTIQEDTFFGKEKNKLPFIVGTMNMILHGISAPNIVRTNSLNENLRDVQEKDRYNIILANPPFGGKERVEVQQNFDIKTSETAFLFLQHFIKTLRAGGRAAIVIKNTFLTNKDNASVALRKELLETCNLHTILDMPGGTFTTAGVKTVVLFFTRGESTKKIWYYQLNPGRNMGKTNPLNDKDMADFISLQKTREESDQSWIVDIVDVDDFNYDLSAKNPNTPEEAPLRTPQEILTKMQELDLETKNILASIKELL
jgi:type I restriction enzyme M protein